MTGKTEGVNAVNAGWDRMGNEMDFDGNHNLVQRLREIPANYDAIGEAADRIEELEKALTFIASHAGQTLISVEHGQPYSIGANAAFEQLAAAAAEAL